MTKKSKDDKVPITRQQQSQKYESSIQAGDLNILFQANTIKNKKQIKKPQQLSLIQKIDSLKEKNQKLYKHAQKKIDRMIEIIDEIEDKQLKENAIDEVKKGGDNNDDSGGGIYQGDSVVKQEKQQKTLNTDIPATSQQQRLLINKTLTYLHNLLTYQKPLSHIKRQFESFYAKLSSFSKQLQQQNPLPEDKKFLLPEQPLTFQQTRLVQQLIRQHYMRTGRFNVAGLFDSYGKNQQQYQNQNQYMKSSSKCNKSNKSSSSISKKKANLKNKQQFNISIRRKQQKLSNKQRSIKKRPKVQLIDLQQNFHQCFTLRNKLINRQFQQPISWCVQQRLYQTHCNPLEYELRLTEIKMLIKQRKYNLAYEKIQKDMVKFLDNYQQEINLLIGYLLWSCGWKQQILFNQESQKQIREQQNQHQQPQPINQQSYPHLHEITQKLLSQRYLKFTISQNEIQKLTQKFTHQYFIHYNISQFDTLEICYKVGKMYQQQYFDSIQLFSAKDREEFLKHRVHCQFNHNSNNLFSSNSNISSSSSNKQSTTIKSPHSIILPFQIPVDNQHLYHSIFVCPVTKQVLSSNDGVEFLSCGHLVSESAKKSMAQVRRSNHKQKCPVCQKDRASDVVKVSF